MFETLSFKLLPEPKQDNGYTWYVYEVRKSDWEEVKCVIQKKLDR